MAINLSTYWMVHENGGCIFKVPGARRIRGLKPKTMEYYGWAMKKLIWHCPEMPTEVEQIAPVYDAPTLGPTSLVNLDRGIRIFLRWAEKHEGHPDPLKDIPKRPKVKTVPKVWFEDEILALLRACITDRDRAMIAPHARHRHSLGANWLAFVGGMWGRPVSASTAKRGRGSFPFRQW